MKDLKSTFSWYRILAFCILLVQVTMIVPAQELYLGRQLGERYLEQYLDRADLEGSQQRWQQLAEQGMLVALAAWESAANYLLEQDPETWQKERDSIQKDLSKATEIRLGEWLLDKLLKAEANPNVQRFASDLEKRTSQWQFQQVESDGTVSLTRQIDKNQASQAENQWLQSNEELVQKYLEEAAVDEALLRNEIRGLGLDEQTSNELVAKAIGSYKSYLSAEYDLILKSETMDLMGDLLYDRKSLRVASAKESADSIALELIQEAQASTEISFQELFDNFEEEIDAQQVEEMRLSGEDWARNFQVQLEEGLAVWDSAEEEFLYQRSLWEQDAIEVYEEGEAAWLEAFQQLRRARQDWEDKIVAEFHKGMDEWSKSHEQQELEIQEAQRELILSLQEEIQRKEEVGVISSSIYNQLRTMLASCYTGVENWYSDWAQKYKRVYSYWKTEDAQRYNQLFSFGELEGLDEALAALENNENWTIDLEHMSSSTTRTKMEQQISQWKAAYIEWFKEELDDTIRSLEARLETDKTTLEEMKGGGNSTISTGGFSTDASAGKLENLRTKIQADSGSLALLKAIAEKTESYTPDTPVAQIISQFNNPIIEQMLGLSFDLSLWESSESLLHQDNGWLTLATSGFLNLETVTKNFLEALDPTAFEGSSSDLDAEIQQLEGVLSYWQGELEVAQELKDYATTTTSSAQTAAETQEALMASEVAFQEALEGYKNQQQVVQENLVSLKEATNQLNKIQIELEEREKKIAEIRNKIIAIEEIEKGLDKEIVVGKIVKILGSLSDFFSQEVKEKTGDLVESYFLKEFETGNIAFHDTLDLVIKNIPRNFREKTEIQLEEMIETSRNIIEKLQSLDSVVFFPKEEAVPEGQSEPEENGSLQTSENLASLQETLLLLEAFVKDVLQSTELAGEGGNLNNLVKALNDDIANQQEPSLQALIQQIKDISSECSKELQYRKDALVFLTEGEPESWKLVEENAPEAAEYQLIRDTFGHLQATTLNEKHSSSLEEIKTLLENTDIWNHATWNELVSTIEKLREAGMNLHSGAYSVLNQLLTTMVHHWCLQNPDAKSNWDKDTLDYRNTIQQGINDIQALESNLLDLGAVQQFIVTDTYSQWEEEEKNLFLDYLEQLEKNNENSHQGTVPVDTNEQISHIQFILSGKRLNLEKQVFLLGLEELQANYLQDNSQIELENLLSQCRDIDGSSLLNPNDWLRVKEMLGPSEFRAKRLNQLQSLGEQWITTMYGCSDEPYSYEVIGLTEAFPQSRQKETENSLLDLQQIDSLLAVTAYNEELTQSVDLYMMMNSELQNLLNEKTNFERQVLFEEQESQKILESYKKAHAQIQEKMEMYQQSVEKEEVMHQAFVQSRLQHRIAQEKYQWATRIYLESVGNSSLQENSQDNLQYASPLRRYNDVLLVVNRYQNALDILSQMKNHQQMQGSEYLDQVDVYSKSLENAYLMEVILSQVFDAVVKQEEITRDAEIKDEMNVSKLFRDYESLMENKTDPGTEGMNTVALELIRIKKTGAGDYVFTLGYETVLQRTRLSGSTAEYYEYVTSKKTGTGDLDRNLLAEYLTNSSETLVRVDGPVQQTRAEVDVRQWLKDIYAKGDDYINNLLLASLHLKTYAPNGMDFLDGQSDIRNAGDFQADQVPEVRKFHSIDTKQRYNGERRDVVANAYNYILSRSGGENDLARYILYRETNLLNENNWRQKERDLVKWLALDGVKDELYDKQQEKIIEAVIAYASAAALAAAAAWFQPWLWAAAAAATAIGIVATDAAISLGAAVDGIYDLMRGSKENVETETNRVNELLSGLIAGERNLDEQWRILNELYYGTGTTEDGQASATSSDGKPNLSSRSILTVLDKIFANNSLVNKKEYQDLLSPQLLDSTISQMVVSPETPLKITDALQEVLNTLKVGLQEEEEKLAFQALNMEESSSIAMMNFHQIIEKSIIITEEDEQRLAQLEFMATDESLSTSQRQAAMEDFEKLYQSLDGMDSETQNQLARLAERAYGANGWNNLIHKKNIYNAAMSLYNSRVDIRKKTEDYTLWLQDLLISQGLAGWQDSAERMVDQSGHQWQLERDLLLRRQSLWEGEIMETLAAGKDSWQRVEESLNKRYSLWRRQFQQELEDRQAEWQDNHLNFLKSKEEWIQNSHKVAIQQGLVKASETVFPVNLEGIEEEIKYLGRAMESSISFEETEAAVDAILADSYLDDLINRASILTGFGNKGGSGIRKIRGSTSSLESHLLARQQVEKNTTLMTNLAERQAVSYGQKILEEVLASYMEGIDSKNQSMVDWQHHLARDAGYRVDGSIRRTVVVDATLFNPIKETQYLPMYQFFTTTSPQLREIDANPGKKAMLQLSLAQGELEQWGREILGTGGRLEEHIGEAPDMVGTPDPDGSKNAAFSDLGSGQMGAILVEYYWNSIQARKGMAELSLAGHDKRLFDDRGLPFTAPTLREVSEIAMNIVGSALGQEWLKYVDDVVFAGIDLGGGYKTAGEIGREVAIKAAGVAIGAGTNWAGNAISDITSTVGRATATAGLNLASGALSTLSTTTLQSMDFDKIGSGDFFNREMFMSHIGNKSMWSSLVAGAASTGVSTYGSGVFGAMGAEANKFYGGAMSLATSAASTAASYGVHAAFNGGDWAGAYEAMGGISVNVASFGALADLVGSGIARNNSTGQNILGKVMDKLDGRGVMLNIGLDGVSAGIGSGGIDLSGNLYDLGKRVLDKRLLESYTAAHGQEKGDAAWNNYVYGDWTQENTSARLASGLDQLELVEQAGFTARTTSNGVGGRLIQLINSGNSYNSAIALGHESYRDGIIGTAEQQGSETLAATTAHTQMALRILDDGKAIQMTENLDMDITAYKLSQHLGDDSIFAGYVAGSYDASADYWKLMDDGSIAYDGHADLYDENGNLIYKTKSRGLEGSLVEIMYGGNATQEEVEKVRDLLEASFDHTTKSDDLANREHWYWNVESNYGKVIDVSKYEEIYNSRVLVDSTTGQTDTIRNLNPRTIYDKMVANGTMDKKPGDSMRSRLARMELRVETDPATVESLEFYENADGGYISYEEFKAKNYITGGMPVLNTRNTFVNRDITTFTGATGNLSVNPHRGVDGSVEADTDSLPLFQNETSKVVYASKGDLDDSNYQGRHVGVQTDVTYTFKGNSIVDELIYRTLHLSSVDVVEGQSVLFDTVLGKTGNSGKWGDSGYGNHSHEDIYTVRPSPYLNYLSDVAYTKAMGNYSPIKESESYGTYKDLYKGNEYDYIFHDNKYYYDKFIFADITQYKKRDSAHSYNKGE